MDVVGKLKGEESEARRERYLRRFRNKLF